MYFLVEQYRYPVSALKQIFGECLGEFTKDSLKTFAGDKIDYILSDNNRYVKFDYVGYCYFNFKEHSGCIFFLPKVVMKGDDESDPNTIGYTKVPKGLILGKYDPSSYIQSERLKEDNYEHYSFVLKLSYEVCKAIRVYWNRLKQKERTSLPQQQALSEISSHLNARPQSLIDLLRSIERFSIENRDWFLFMTQQSRNPQTKINWRKTIQSTIPVFQDGVPIYLNPQTTQKVVDFDEELMTIFNSILKYINKEYDLHCPVNEGYELIEGELFDYYLHGFGCQKLAQIRYRYFSDKTLMLWNICNEFFLHHNTSDRALQHEYLLAKGFHNVFERMMDHLIGDDVNEQLIRQKQLKDGKVIDHLYKDRSIINPLSEIMYIADSKYYTIGASISEESQWKQYTYAADIQNECIKEGWVMDSLTRGYDIIPNYLISATLPEKDITNFDYDKIKGDPLNRHGNHIEHIDNCIFSNSTKYIFRYHVNFLFVITLFARDNDIEVEEFKTNARAEFRRRIIEEYNHAYRFFKISESRLPSNTDYIDLLVLRMENGGYLPNIGKVFSFIDTDGRQFIIGLARKDESGNPDEETYATINALLSKGYITPSSSTGKFEEEYTLQ